MNSQHSAISQRNTLRQAMISILDEFDRVCRTNNLSYFLCFGTLLGAVRHKGFIPWDDDVDVVMPREDYSKLLKIADREFNDSFYLQKPCVQDKSGRPYSKVYIKDSLFIIDKQLNPEELEGHWKEFGIFVDVFPLDSTRPGWTGLRRMRAKFIAYLSKFIHAELVGLPIHTGKFGLIAKVLRRFSLPGLIRVRDRLQIGRGRNYACFFGFADVARRTFDKEWFLNGCYAEFEGKRYPVPSRSDLVLKTIYGADYMELPPEDKRTTHNPIYLRFKDLVIDNREKT